MEHLLQHVEQWIGDLEKWVRQLPPEQLYTALVVLLLTATFLLLGMHDLMQTSFMYMCTVSFALPKKKCTCAPLPILICFIFLASVLTIIFYLFRNP